MAHWTEYLGLFTLGTALLGGCTLKDNTVGWSAPAAGEGCDVVGSTSKGADGCSSCTCGNSRTWACSDAACLDAGKGNGDRGAAGNAAAGNGAAGNGSAGNGSAGNGSAGGGTSGSGAAGNAAAGNGAAGNGAAGNGAAGNGAAGNGAAGNGAAGGGTTGSGAAGEGPAGGAPPMGGAWCPAIACTPTAEFRADLPATIDPTAGVFRACRNDECYQDKWDGSLVYNGLSLSNPQAENDNLDVSLAFYAAATGGTEIGFYWMHRTPAYTGFRNGDRYRVSFVNTSTAEETAVIDQTVDYEILDLGCAGSCLVSSVDLRGGGN